MSELIADFLGGNQRLKNERMVESEFFRQIKTGYGRKKHVTS